MPITQHDKEHLSAALAAFEGQDSFAIARLIYESLRDACTSPTNPNGMTTEAITSLGRAIYDKIQWAQLAEIEKAIGGQPIRLPLIKSVDTVLRSRFVEALPVLAEEHKHVFLAVFEKMNELEIVGLGRLVYETLCNTGFPVAQPFSGLHPLSKFLYSMWSWDDLKSRRETAEGICVALGMAVDAHFRTVLADAFSVEEPKAEESPDPAITPEVAAAVEVAVAVDAAEANQVSEPNIPPVGGASDLEPFAPVPEEGKDEEPLGAQDEEGEEEAPTVPVEEPQEEPAQETASEEVVETKPDETAEEPSKTNGHRLSKKERRALRKQNKEAQS